MVYWLWFDLLNRASVASLGCTVRACLQIHVRYDDMWVQYKDAVAVDAPACSRDDFQLFQQTRNLLRDGVLDRLFVPAEVTSL